MTFTSISFLIFFSCIFVLYYFISFKLKPLFLLIISYVFYGLFDLRFLPYLWIVTIITIIFTKYIIVFPKHKKNILILDILFILGILIYFKYFNFIVQLFGRSDLSIENILLPVGISFFTFQSLGYAIDVYRNSNNYEQSLVNIALFISFFPQITSGPISRASDLIPQLKILKKPNSSELESGLYQFLWGMFKKLVIADNFAIVANLGFNQYETIFGLPILISVISYTIQIYGDFSGYSDMSLGLSKMLGFKLKDNFNSPYLSISIKDFWKRWHISLSSWFKDYVYIPLGGSRVGVFRKYLNILITFTVSGLWHGANLTFIVWGMLHGLYQIVEDILTTKFSPKRLPYILKWFITMALISFAWIFFRSNSIEQALGVIESISKFTFPTSLGWLSGMLSTVGIYKYQAFVLTSSLFILTLVEVLNHKGYAYFYDEIKLTKTSFIWGTGLIVLILMFGAFSNPSFIYFNF